MPVCGMLVCVCVFMHAGLCMCMRAFKRSLAQQYICAHQRVAHGKDGKPGVLAHSLAHQFHVVIHWVGAGGELLGGKLAGG